MSSLPHSPIICTVTYLLGPFPTHTSVLFGRHKDTPGARRIKMVGKINAFGGKFKPEIDESIKHCAARETFEECGLRPSIESLSRTGIIRFENPTSPVEVHFFFATRWEGELLTESDEMAEIGWHPLSAPPYDQMMSADRKFRLIGRLYEALKQGKVLTATITHDKNMEVIRHSDFLLVHGPL